MITRLAYVEGVLDRGGEGLNDDIRRKDNVAVLIQHVAAVAGHGVAPLAPIRREHPYLSAAGASRVGPLPAME